MRRLRRARLRQARAKKGRRRQFIAAGAAAAISLTGAGKTSAAPPVDKHVIAVMPDADRDFLTDREEVAIGYRPFEPDQNRNLTQDGIELAQRCARAIAALPSKPEITNAGQTYREEVLMFGQEQCTVCAETLNMGFLRIVNPRLDLDVEFSLIGLHGMEHGAFSYAGTVNRGRADVARLLRVLEMRFPYEPDDHQLPLDGDDLDGDLLADGEELAAGLNLHDADQNENLLPDGVEIARRCAEIIDRLPTFPPEAADAKGVYKIDFMMRGIEFCDVCGDSVNMGYSRIVNADTGDSLDVPVIAGHYMQHGSFGYAGDVHGRQRVDVPSLLRILEWPARCGDVGMPPLPGDLDGNCVVDLRDLAALAERWLESREPANEQLPETK